jgi:hypothetical protein
MHNGKLCDLYSSTNIISMIKSRRMRFAGHGAQMQEKRKAYRVLVMKPDTKRQLGKCWQRCVCNIKVGLEEIGQTGFIWLRMGQVANSCENY